MNELVKYENGSIQVALEACKKIADFKKRALEVEMAEKELKAQLKNAMEEHGISTFENDYIKVAYRKPSTRTSIDSKKLKEECPDVYAAYSKTSNVASSITLEVK